MVRSSKSTIYPGGKGEQMPPLHPPSHALDCIKIFFCIFTPKFSFEHSKRKIYALTKFLRNYGKIKPLPAVETKNNQSSQPNTKSKRLNSPGISPLIQRIEKDSYKSTGQKLKPKGTKFSHV